MTALLSVNDLSLTLSVDGEQRSVLHRVSFELEAGKVLGLVGESGSGKTMTARSTIRLLPPHAVSSGEIRFDGRSVLEMGRRELRAYRASDVAMVFQDPRAHINPVRKVGDFLTEGLIRSKGQSRPAARRAAIGALEDMRIHDAERRMDQFPHQLSGGLLQRVMIAATLLSEPRLILADEPTTALDVTTQAEVVALLETLARERGMAMLFITHDLELALGISDEVAVMYAGEIVEQASSERVEHTPRHPYSAALIAARPSIERRVERMAQVRGRPLSAFEAPPGCAFQTRCDFVLDACRGEHPQLRPVGESLARCLRADEFGTRAPVPVPAAAPLSTSDVSEGE